VTVSIAAETIGIFKLMFLENFVERSTLRGKTLEKAGINKTSSKVNPSITTLSAINDIKKRFKILLHANVRFFLDISQRGKKKT
jgi:hypothetical protein